MEADAWGHRLTGEDPLPCGAHGASCGRALSARDGMGACAPAGCAGAVPVGRTRSMLFTCPQLWTCGLSLHVSFQKRPRCRRPLFARVLFIMLARMWRATDKLPAPQARKSQLDSFSWLRIRRSEKGKW